MRKIFATISILSVALLTACGDGGGIKLRGSKAGTSTAALASLEFGPAAALEEAEKDVRAFATSGLNPSSLSMKIYKFYVSTDVNCTNPIKIYENVNPTYSNMYSNPRIGSGEAPTGTYPCVIFEAADFIKFVPAQTSDNNRCVAGTEYSLDICRTDSSGSSIGVDGTTTTCTGNGTTASEDRVHIYLSSASTGVSGGQNGPDAFKPPVGAADATRGIKLTAPMVITGSNTAVFQMDGTGAVEENGTNCDHQPPTFGFTSF